MGRRTPRRSCGRSPGEYHWIAATASFPERYGHVHIPAMIDLLDGKDVPRDLLMPHVAVTAENMAELYADMPDCGLPLAADQVES